MRVGMDEEETRHLLQQVPSKHLSLLQRQRESGEGFWYRRGTSLCVCEGRERVSERHQSTSLRSLTGSSCTMLRWFMARLKAIWTALRMLDVRPSIILILSMVLSIPRGTILDLGSHCLKGGKDSIYITTPELLAGAECFFTKYHLPRISLFSQEYWDFFQ